MTRSGTCRWHRRSLFRHESFSLSGPRLKSREKLGRLMWRCWIVGHRASDQSREHQLLLSLRNPQHLDTVTSEALRSAGSGNPCREALQERVVRQIRMLRAMRRELERGLRPRRHGHARRNPDTVKARPTGYGASSRPYQPIPAMLAGLPSAEVSSGISPFDRLVSCQKYRNVFRWRV